MRFVLLVSILLLNVSFLAANLNRNSRLQTHQITTTEIHLTTTNTCLIKLRHDLPKNSDKQKIGLHLYKEKMKTKKKDEISATKVVKV